MPCRSFFRFKRAESLLLCGLNRCYNNKELRQIYTAAALLQKIFSHEGNAQSYHSCVRLSPYVYNYVLAATGYRYQIFLTKF